MGSAVSIPVDDIIIVGDLAVPDDPLGLVIFAHGSGSSRLSPRNQYIARELNKKGFATLLIDLLTSEEEAVDEETSELRFNLELLSERIIGAAKWSRQNESTLSLPIGFFGASTGGGAALVAAAKYPDDVKAIVSRGGRPDLALKYLPKVEVPVLLVVGSEDDVVIQMNETALAHLKDAKLVIVKGASHLFEEQGKLEEVARLAGEWFSHHLR